MANAEGTGPHAEGAHIRGLGRTWTARPAGTRHNRGEGIDNVRCELDAVPALARDLLDDPGVAEVVDGMVSGGLGSAKTILDRPGRERGMVDQDR
jgi:hypothetical protein